jgi:hypothetical protein
MTNTSEYTPGPDSAVAQNGRGKSGTNSFGFINVACGTHVDLVIAFTVNGTPAILERFYMTYADLDSDNAGLMHEYFGVFSPYQEKYLGNVTELDERAMDSGGRKWVSTKPGTGSNNPNNPNFLTSAEQNRAVTLEFVNTSSIKVVVGVTKSGDVCNGARNVMFALRSNMVPYVCNTCTVATNGSPSCCADGASWSGLCGDAAKQASGKKYFSFKDGFDACPTASPTANPTKSETPSPTASPTASPTPNTNQITPSPTKSSTVSAVGDPHMINVKGEKFDLVRSGRIQLLRVPLEAVAEEANLTVDAMIVDMAGSIDGCTTAPYIQTVTFGGRWLGGRSLAVSSKAGKMQVLLDGMWPMVSAQPEAIGSVKLAYVHPTAMELQVGDASVRVSHGVQMFHFFLNMQASSLSSLGYTLGGLLGGDDHRPFSTLPSECFVGSSMRLASTSRAGTSNNALLASASLWS